MLVIKRNIEKVWGARYTLDARYLYIIRDAGKVWGARYLPKNTVFSILDDRNIIFAIVFNVNVFLGFFK
jgi:hypothetical protein